MEEENEKKDINLEISMFDFLKGKEDQADSDIYKSMKNIMVNTFESIESRYKSKTNNSDFIETDFCAMDFHRGDLIVIASRTSIGKTAFTLSIANQIALHKKIPVGYISLGCWVIDNFSVIFSKKIKNIDDDAYEMCSESLNMDYSFSSYLIENDKEYGFF